MEQLNLVILCTEIIEYSDKDETAVCNLASISLPSCLDYTKFYKKFTIYSKDDCPFCDYTKKIISKMNVQYEVILNLMIKKIELNFTEKLMKKKIN